MSRLFVSGDTHGQIDIHKFTTKEFPIQSELTRDDVVWILGDFGVCWDGAGQDRWIQNWWADKPFTVIATQGNHENYTLIKQLPIVEKFGGLVRQVKDNVFYAMNDTYRIAGRRILNVNGADSYDVYVNGKPYRKAYVDWWPEERITEEDVIKARVNWKKTGLVSDFVFSHAGGTEVCVSLGFKPTPSDKMLDEILYYGFYQTHYCGHMHRDIWATVKSRIVYKDILEVGKYDDN